MQKTAGPKPITTSLKMHCGWSVWVAKTSCSSALTTVVSAERSLSRKGGYVVHVKLDDGKQIDAVSLLAFMPAPGSHAEVKMARHQSGLVTYNVNSVDQ